MASSNEEIGREPFSWKRTWALAVAIGLHAFAFLLLVAPMAPPSQKHTEKEHIVQVNFIEPPPPPPPPPLPPQPPPTRPPPSPPPAGEEGSANAVAAAPPAPPAPPAAPADIAAGSDLSYGSRPDPKYPPQAVREHHTGTVVLMVLVGLDGTPKTVTVEN